MKIDKIVIYLIPGSTENDQPREIIVAKDRVEGIKFPWETKLAAYLLEWIDKKS